jgi:hypothetical protein
LARDTILVGYAAYLAADTGCRVDLTPWLDNVATEVQPEP